MVAEHCPPQEQRLAAGQVVPPPPALLASAPVVEAAAAVSAVAAVEAAKTALTPEELEATVRRLRSLRARASASSPHPRGSPPTLRQRVLERRGWLLVLPDVAATELLRRRILPMVALVGPATSS